MAGIHPAARLTALRRDLATRGQEGFTLLELMVASAILVVVSMLTFVVVQSANSGTCVAQAKEAAQASVRDALTAMSAEIQLASKRSNDALVPALEALRIVNASELVFQIPADTLGLVWSPPITYRFVNEDTAPEGVEPNARLDPGEDVDEDGALTRRILRIQGDDVRPIGAANDLSAVQFLLSPNNDVLTISLSATKAVEDRRHDLVRVTATSRVHLVN